MGQKGKLPAAVTPAVVGMRKNGIRRVLVPPALGWGLDPSALPQVRSSSSRRDAEGGALDWREGLTRLGQPDNYGGSRRLANHRDEPLLFEVEMVRVKAGAGVDLSDDDYEALNVGSGLPFKLPAPPQPYGTFYKKR